MSGFLFYLAVAAILVTAGVLVVGVGNMGLGHINYVKKDPQGKLLAVCDVDEHRLAAALKKAGPGCKGYKDFRDVLDRGDIDVLHNVTPPHWHTLAVVKRVKRD